VIFNWSDGRVLDWLSRGFASRLGHFCRRLSITSTLDWSGRVFDSLRCGFRRRLSGRLGRFRKRFSITALLNRSRRGLD
jgi:hypothetical protein